MVCKVDWLANLLGGSFMWRTPKKIHVDFRSFAEFAHNAGRAIAYKHGQTIFSDGDPASCVFYIQKGKRETLRRIDAGQRSGCWHSETRRSVRGRLYDGGVHRVTTATAISKCDLIRIRKGEFRRELHTSQLFSDNFISYLLDRNVTIEESLIDQLFNSTEKRLARALLLLAHYGKTGKSEAVIPKVTQTMLAEMIGTSRPRVTTFMNRFKKLGFIRYNGGLHVNSSLFSVVLHD